MNVQIPWRAGRNEYFMPCGTGSDKGGMRGCTIEIKGGQVHCSIL